MGWAETIASGTYSVVCYSIQVHGLDSVCVSGLLEATLLMIPGKL